MPPDKNICGEHTEAIATLKKESEAQWTAIDKLRNRPPIWATAVISILTFALGFTLNYAVMTARMAMLASK